MEYISTIVEQKKLTILYLNKELYLPKTNSNIEKLNIYRDMKY
jgi:hypothetical protein